MNNLWTFRSMKVDKELAATLDQAMVMCGGSDAYQNQAQSSMNTSIRLLLEDPDPSCSPDPALAKLAKEVNDFLEPKAKALLKKKRDALKAAKRPDVAERTEFTVLATGKGLQLAYSYALPRKEVAPMPRKTFLRRVLGPLYPNRKYWVMPEHDGQDAKVETVRWPWIFWVAVLLALVGGTVAFTAMR